MPITIRQFIALRDPQQLITIGRREPIQAALALMVANDFTLLPVVDDTGLLTGVISEQSVVRTYYHAEGEVGLLQLPVVHCEEEAKTVSLDDRLTTALRLLEDSYAVIIVDGRRPRAILTDYDTNRFFRDFSEDLIKVEKVERQLRQYVETVFADPSERRRVANVARQATTRNGRRKDKRSDWLTFNEYIRIIDNDEHWHHFEQAFESRLLFASMMDKVREIRNQLAHFDERPTAAQRDLLRRALHWIETRPELTAASDKERDEAHLTEGETA